jgi:cytochrome c-type biogenesis protein CcmH/NrfG
LNINLKTCRNFNRRCLLIFATALAASASWAFSATTQQPIVGDDDSRARSKFDVSIQQADQRTGSDIDAEKLFQLAKEQVRQGNFVSADSTLRSYLQRQPNSAEGLYLLGEVLMRRNNPKDSLISFTHAAALRRPTGEELRLVGLSYILLEDYADAIKWLKKAIELSPGNAEVWYSLGRAQYGEDDYADAETSFR